MKKPFWFIGALGLSLAFQLSGCATGPNSPQVPAIEAGAPDADFAVQQFGPYQNRWVRQRIRAELERGYPDYSPEVLSLNVRPISQGRTYAFRARIRVIGIAGPSLPLLYRVEGTYDRIRDRVIETRRTPLNRPAGR